MKDKQTELSRLQSDEAKTHQRFEVQAKFLLPDLTGDSKILAAEQELLKAINNLDLPDVPENLFDDEKENDQEVKALYIKAAHTVSSTQEQLRQTSNKYIQSINELKRRAEESSWSSSRKTARVSYELLWGRGGEEAQSKQKLELLIEERNKLTEKIEKYNQIRNVVESFRGKATECLSEIVEIRTQITQKRSDFIVAHNTGETLLHLELIKMGAEPKSVERSLRDTLGIDQFKFSDAISGERSSSLMNVYKNANSNEEGVKLLKARIKELAYGENEQGFTSLQNNLKNRIEHTPQILEAIDTWFPEDRLKLKYRTEESGVWKPITEGSIGQQNAAILSFLLSFGTEPLVIDQPEDDLDTRMIMSLIVDQVRKMKEKRQIIIVTHNPNIVVHGDADLVHAMDDNIMGGQVFRSELASGGLQSEATRTFICDVMEGGNIAFKRRFERMSSLK